jgi:chromosomal replication initiation ATPase DnaA
MQHCTTDNYRKSLDSAWPIRGAYGIPPAHRRPLERVAEAFGVRPELVLSDSRQAYLMPARFALYKIMYDRCHTLVGAAAAVGRDHKTVAYGINRAEWMIEHDAGFAAMYAEAVGGDND